MSVDIPLAPALVAVSVFVALAAGPAPAPPLSTGCLTSEADINALAEAGIASGCGPGLYCPDGAVLHGPLGWFLHRAFD